MWMYPGNYSPFGITVELGEAREIPFVGGICTDHPVSWRDKGSPTKEKCDVNFIA